MYTYARIFSFLIVISLFFVGCNSPKTSKTEEGTKISYKDSLHIDFDFDKVAKHYSDRIANGDSISIKKEENYQLLLIATDRFWKTVEYVDSHLRSNVTKADDINVSERVFTGFMKQLTDGNTFIQESIQKGLTPKVSQYKQSSTK